MEEQLLLFPKVMMNWFAEKATVEARANKDVLEKLFDKPLSEPRVLQAFLCRWCLNPVMQIPKSAPEYMHLRAVAMIPDAVADPPICRDCFDQVVGSFNRRATNIGTNNAGHSNLALAQLAG